MKKIFISLIITASFFVSCGNTGKDTKKSEPNPVTTEVEQESQIIVKELTYKKFIKDVWNIEENPDNYVYEGELPCIIDFYADWCGPCKKVAPILEKLAKKYEGQIIVYKVNTDNERKLASIFQIRSIPTVFYMPLNGQPAMMVGALSEAEYLEAINKYLIKKI